MFFIRFHTNNDSFQGNSNKEKESARILREIADKVERGNWNGYIQDINGNRIGTFFDVK